MATARLTFRQFSVDPLCLYEALGVMMLLEMGIGDAYGAGREYADPKDVAANNDGKSYVQHQKWEELAPGRYTDDT